MTVPERAALAAAQERLLAALVGDAQPPPGFDPERLRVQSEVLRAKRAHSAPSPRPRTSFLRRLRRGGAA
ncbi:MAG: hypothetical protein HOY69_00125 [Streptomyces sp.]|nr:hypothetical protein [Streptomyces sp.]